ncbi:transposase [Nocardia puris]|nr:transposase [Nocardia puris]
MTTPGAEALTRDRLRHVDQHYIRSDTMAAANTVLVNAQAGVALAQLWGGGLVASVDGMRFVVPVRTIHARANRKYFGPKKGATWPVNDQAAGLNGMVVSGTPRDSLNALDVVLCGKHGPEDIITDSGSYSDIVFGLLHLLDYKYRPQLKNLPDQRCGASTRPPTTGPSTRQRAAGSTWTRSVNIGRTCAGSRCRCTAVRCPGTRPHA